MNVAKINIKKTPNWRPKWLIKDRGNRPVTVECDRGGHAADFVSPEGSNLRSSRPSSSNYLPQKNDTAFVEKGEQGAEGTRKGDGDL